MQYLFKKNKENHIMIGYENGILYGSAFHKQRWSKVHQFVQHMTAERKLLHGPENTLQN